MGGAIVLGICPVCGKSFELPRAPDKGPGGVSLRPVQLHFKAEHPDKMTPLGIPYVRQVLADPN
jgi:hypothetical protein